MRPEGSEPNAAPADDRPTFLAHALALSALHGHGPWPDGGRPLPDEAPRPADGRPFVSSVVLEGIRTHHVAGHAEPARESAVAIAGLIDDLARNAHDTDAIAALHGRLAEEPAVDVADDLVTELRRRRPPKAGLHRVARHLVEYGTSRDSVKFGIVMLVLAGDERDRELLLMLGALEELTLYAVVALMNTQPDPQRAAYELARRVRGWGRIHAVERLKGCTDQDVKAWLLREGFRNEVMNEYLAHLAATTGGLYSALLESEVDEALLDGAGAILAALACGGPAKDMTDYEDAVPATHRYLQLIATAEPTLGRLDDVLTIGSMTGRSGEEVDWPAGEPERLVARHRTVLDRPAWSELVFHRLANATDEYEFNVALSCASRLGLPVLQHALDRLEGDPFNGYVWQWAMRHAGPDTVTEVTELAERLIPVDQLGSGVDRNMGFGSAHASDRAFETVVGGLDRHPGAGLTILRTALTSRIVQLRRSALRSLSAWPRESFPDQALDWIGTAARREPNSELRDRLTAFLAQSVSRPT